MFYQYIYHLIDVGEDDRAYSVKVSPLFTTKDAMFSSLAEEEIATFYPLNYKEFVDACSQFEDLFLYTERGQPLDLGTPIIVPLTNWGTPTSRKLRFNVGKYRDNMDAWFALTRTQNGLYDERPCRLIFREYTPDKTIQYGEKIHHKI
jgi:hypothetical protein